MNFKLKKNMLKFTQKVVLLKGFRKNQYFENCRKIAAQAFEAGDFLNIFLTFWGV